MWLPSRGVIHVTSCALWPLPCRLAPAIPALHRAAFVQAAVAGLAPGSPPPVQIGACRALAQVGGEAASWRLTAHA
jgi:hypothetical protein